MNKFPKGVVLVAFGTTWVPDTDMIDRLVKAFKEFPEIGFIIGSKN
jgi:hypothetical protein